MYYTYVLYSKIDQRLYIGFTDNLKQRLKMHIDGRVPATRDRRPLILVYVEGCLSKFKALGREKYFKTGFGRRYLKSRIGF